MADARTVIVSDYKNFRAIRMLWRKQGEKEDIKQAFEDIVAHLEAATEPIFVVVDMRENSFMPMTDTFKGAMSGAHRHPNLEAWLCIGGNKFAHYVADVLNHFTEESKIKWFKDEVEIDAYLEAQHIHI